MRHLLLLLILCGAMPALAQTLRGTVVAEQTGLPVTTAQLVFTTYSDSVFTAQPDERGMFRFERLPVGGGMLSAIAEGYAPFLMREIFVAAGKEQVVDILMATDQWERTISPIDVVARRPLREPEPIGEIPLSRAQTLYNPMTFFDPARLATASAGVAQGDDGTNAMSVRGNNPAFVRWRLQGMDIVSPNHLPNAGTLGDLPSPSSGGVLMLSAQMLDNSALVTGAGPLGFNDGIAGVMDLQLRKGNNVQHEQTLQLGLTGLDAAAEGPLSRRRSGKGSYLFNYRYSFVGLLSAMGVSFGGEKITFQDAAIHLHFPTKKRGEWSVFALVGQSSNRYQRPDSATTYKELFNIDFASKSLLAGVSNTKYFGQRYVAKMGFSISKQENDREQKSKDGDFSSIFVTETRASFNYNGRLTVLPNHTLVAGINVGTYSAYDFIGQSQQRDVVFELVGQVQAWVGGEWSLRKGAIQVHYGLNAFLPNYLDPRLQLRLRLDQQHQLVFALASNTQRVPFWMKSGAGASDYMRALHQSVRYNYLPSINWVLSAEAFAQQISSVLGVDATGQPHFAINQSEYQPFLRYDSDAGTATNTGLELSAVRRLAKGWFAHANMTLLHSQFIDEKGINRRTRWDVGQIANLTSGKEWKLRLRRQLTGRVLGVSARAVYRGGYRAAPVDLFESVAAQRTIYDVRNGYTERDAAYFRLDGRIYWKRSISNRRNSTFALEFQNLTNQKNIAFRYYDPFKQSVDTKYQLGMIPNLSWRIEL